MMRAADIHSRIGSAWPIILEQLGIHESALRNKHGPCPACGGTDRFRFDNRRERGDYFCNHCGVGDGFTLLQRVYKWTFREARQQVIRAAGLDYQGTQSRSRVAATPTPSAVAAPPARVLRLWQNRCAVADCDEAVAYLTSRGLWPLPEGCALSAHPAVEYFDEGRRIGRYSALLADIRDVAGALVSVHVTYLQAGRKLATREPRKILSTLGDRMGCAVRLTPTAGEMGIAEGIETALSASAIDGIPVWAALSASLLARFEPPPGIASLRVFADNDKPGVEAAQRLVERLQGRVCTEVHTPPRPAKDWNDVSMARSADPTEAKQQGRLE
jgi:putative DNA primase/helicase